jgi:enoyl-CoA hydratase/carnithine racemase
LTDTFRSARLRFHHEGDIEVITLASPERRNAPSRDIVDGVLGCLRSPQSATARAIVLTGEGTPFCAGILATCSVPIPGWVNKG